MKRIERTTSGIQPTKPLGPSDLLHVPIDLFARSSGSSLWQVRPSALIWLQLFNVWQICQA